jgi:hypothetical protein
MKNIFYIIQMLFCANLFAQSFLPFNSASRKLYRDDIGNTYSLSFQLANANQSDSVFIPTLNIDPIDFYSDSCVFWGGNFCNKQNKSGWLGKRVKTNNNHNYSFYINDSDSLNFTFNTDGNDTNLVCQNNNERVRMSFANSTYTQILGYTDSVHYYNLYHTDMNGNPINSVLNQFQLAIGKQLGLINFLCIDSFPSQIKTLSLLGNTIPNAGIYAITDELVYDYNIGDEYQWHNYSITGMPPTYYNGLVKNTILNKTISTDSVFYSILENTINLNTNVQILDTIEFNIQKNNAICGIPIEIFDGSYYKQFKEIEICGNNYWELTMMNEPYNLAYCAIDTCWGSIDTQGPAASITKKMVLGLGQTNLQDLLSSPFPPSHNISSELIYFKKNGQICGLEQIVPAAEKSKDPYKLKISPNPANQKLNIEYMVAEKGSELLLTILNLEGQILLEKKVTDYLSSSNTAIIDVSELNNGFYILNVAQNGQLIQSAKFIKN